jgi:hypothetical protein
MSAHYVYVVAHSRADGLHGPVKIGITSSLGSRLTGLQTGNPNQIAVAHVFAFPTRDQALKIEKTFHEDYAEHRLSGEWFNVTPFDALEGLCNVVRSCVDDFPMSLAERKAALQWSGYENGIATVRAFYGWDQ